MVDIQAIQGEEREEVVRGEDLVAMVKEDIMRTGMIVMMEVMNMKGAMAGTSNHAWEEGCICQLFMVSPFNSPFMMVPQFWHSSSNSYFCLLDV